MDERAKRINKAIEQSGYSYPELSKITGISKSSLQRYATGETKKIPIDCIESIAKATNTSAKYLMGWEEEEPPTEPTETELTANEREMIDIFKGLTPTQQGKLIERAKIMSEDNETEAIAKENAS